jgi:AraC-like DNA-binding protein
MYFYKDKRWDWRTKILCGESCHEDTPCFIIKKAGRHTLTLRVKELDAKIDKIVLKREDTVPGGPKEAGKAQTDRIQKRAQKGLPRPVWALLILSLGILVPGAVLFTVKRLLRSRRIEPTRYSKHSKAMEKALHYININFSKEITLSGLAREVGLSENYMGRVFKEESGKSFVQYLNDFRIDKALELMKTTPLNVTEIHHKVGIHHSSYFAKVFRQRTGVPPSEEIKKYRK